MRTRRFFARSTPDALLKISAAWGQDALILANRPVAGGIEILAKQPQTIRIKSRPAMPLQRNWAALLANEKRITPMATMTLTDIELRLNRLQSRDSHNAQFVSDLAQSLGKHEV